jgi:hypothetical protein
VFSVLVAEASRTPARPDQPTSAFWEAVQEAGALVVHILLSVTGPWSSGLPPDWIGAGRARGAGRGVIEQLELPPVGGDPPDHG